MSSQDNQDNRAISLFTFADIKMDLSLRVFSFVFSVCVVIGAFMTWRYLYSEGVGGEIVGLLGSPLTLFSMAIYGVLVALYLILLLLSVPIMLQLISSPSVKWNTPHRKFKPMEVWVSVSGVLVSFIIAVWFEVESNVISLLFASLVLLITSLVYKSKEGANRGWSWNQFEDFVKLLMVFLFGGMLLVFLIVIFATAVAGREVDFQWQIILLIALSVVYGFCVSIINQPKKLQNYSLLAVFTFLLIVFLSDNVSRNIAKEIGLGGFETNITVLNTHVTELPKEIDVRPARESKTVSALEKVWVVAALPGKIILASPDHKNVTYSIPPKAILSEWSWWALMCFSGSYFLVC